MKDLPVDPERLRRQFPALTDEDLAAYVEVTQAVMRDVSARAKAMATLMATARGAREKKAAGQALNRDEERALLYLSAVEKMQGRVGQT